MFVPLHLKSDYSLGYGANGVAELVRRAAHLGYRTLALTDLENLYGQVRFHHECRAHGIRPVTGVELRQGFGSHGCPGDRAGRVVLLAADQGGYRNLCRIVSARRAGEAAGHDPLPLVLRHPAGLFALSDDAAVIERLLAGGVFPAQRLGLLLLRPSPHPTSPNAPLPSFLAHGVRLVADLDVVFLHRADHDLHLLQQAVARGRSYRDMAAMPDLEDPERWLCTPLQAERLFADVPEALANAEEIARLCDFELGGGQAVQRFGFGTEDADHRELARLCQAAIGDATLDGEVAAYRDRLAVELEVLESLGFSGFMLAVAAILEHCRQEGIPVTVRGSAVSSLVLHLLGGSPVDPVRMGLLFERFLHAGKSAWPDVDIDLPWHRRDEVIDWVYRRFGEDRVAMVAALHTFQARSALREGLKALGVAPQVVERLAARLPREETEAGLGAQEDTTAYQGATVPDAEPSLLRQFPELAFYLSLVRRLVGRPRHVAVHPGGVVIDRHPLSGVLPLERAAKGVIITQYDLVAVAQLGLVKIDLLGNRCLSEIDETLSLAGWPRPIRMSAIPPEDPATLELIDRARTVGCFQLESPAMRSLLARLPIRRQSDLTAALALIRPGAASGEVKESFVRRARGEERPVPTFPALADRLAETYGLPIYEEDIMVLLQRSGGLTPAESNEMRRAIVKGGADPALLAVLRGEFLEKARHRLGDASAVAANAGRAWQVAARFAAYSFNKAHAASYALLSYYSAYLKAHHPVEFTCALMNHHQGLYPLRVVASEFARMGVALARPHVNASQYRSSLTEAGAGRPVQVGLAQVKRLSRRAAQELVQERTAHGPFLTLGDLLGRVRLAVHEVQALVFSGACDGLAPLATEEYPFPHEAALEWLRQGGDPIGLDTLRYNRAVVESAEERERLRLYQGLVRARNELAYLELHLTAHPMALLRGEAGRVGCLTIEQAAAAAPGRGARVAAVLAAMRRVPTRQGTLMFLTLEDETGLLEAVLPPKRCRELGGMVTTPGPFLVEGLLRLQQGAPHLEIRQMKPFHQRSAA